MQAGRRSGARPRHQDDAPQRADFYALDNALLRSQSTGIHLRQSPTILDNDLSTPLLKWGTIVRGVPLDRTVEAQKRDKEVQDADLSLRDTYGRKIRIESEPREWLVVKGVRNLRGKTDPVTRQWYIPYDITHVPILLKKAGMLTDDESDEEDDFEKGRYSQVPEPTDTPPFQLGSGLKYEVVYQSVVVRSSPSLNALAQSREMKGAVVEMFDWDPTLKWRMVYDKNRRLGWMMLDHPEFGALLRPQCLPFQVRPVQPMCAAVLEANCTLLKKFINEGMDVDVQDAGGRTPLMVAAEFGRNGPIVVLFAAGADASLLNENKQEALDVASSEVTKTLLLALTSDKRFDATLCQAAIEEMDDDAREMAEDLLSRKMRRMKFFQPEKPHAGEAPKPGPMQRRPKPKSDEEEDRISAVDVKALAVRGKCGLCQSECRQAIMATCCVALFCSDCIVAIVAGRAEAGRDVCPGCDAEIPTSRLVFLKPEEAKEEVEARIQQARTAASEDAAEKRRQAC